MQRILNFEFLFHVRQTDETLSSTKYQSKTQNSELNKHKLANMFMFVLALVFELRHGHGLGPVFLTHTSLQHSTLCVCLCIICIGSYRWKPKTKRRNGENKKRKINFNIKESEKKWKWRWRAKKCMPFQFPIAFWRKCLVTLVPSTWFEYFIQFSPFREIRNVFRIFFFGK